VPIADYGCHILGTLISNLLTLMVPDQDYSRNAKLEIFVFICKYPCPISTSPYNECYIVGLFSSSTKLYFKVITSILLTVKDEFQLWTNLLDQMCNQRSTTLFDK